MNPQTFLKRGGAVTVIAAALTAAAPACPPAYAFGPGAIFGILGGLVGTVLRPRAYYYRPYVRRHYAERRAVRRRPEERRAEERRPEERRAQPVEQAATPPSRRQAMSALAEAQQTGAAKPAARQQLASAEPNRGGPAAMKAPIILFP